MEEEKFQQMYALLDELEDLLVRMTALGGDTDKLTDKCSAEQQRQLEARLLEIDAKLEAL